MSDWKRVNRQNRCQRCSSDSWCCYTESSILCMRDSSGRTVQMKDGSVGYMFSITGDKPLPWFERKEPERKAEVNVPALIAKWKSKTNPAQLSYLATQLNVRGSALLDLEACYAEEYGAWAFPMKDGFGNMVGVRLRNFLGDKWAVKGSQSGVFIPKCPSDGVAVIVEGPTDSCAVLSMGMWPIGRPSCSGGLPYILAAIGRFRIYRVLIIADNDSKRRPDGTPWNPGLDGALTLQKNLTVPSCIVTLPCKDIREFVKLGGSSQDLEFIVKAMTWVYPKKYEQERNNISPAFTGTVRRVVPAA